MLLRSQETSNENCHDNPVPLPNHEPPVLKGGKLNNSYGIQIYLSIYNDPTRPYTIVIRTCYAILLNLLYT